MLDKPSKKQQALAGGGLLLTTVIWGWGFVFAKLGLNAGLSPVTMQMGRFVLASVCAGLFFRNNIRKNYKKGQWKACFWIGSLLFAAFVVQNLGLAATTPGNNAFVTATYVVMVPFVSWVVFGKRPGSLMFLASVAALVGLAVLTLDLGAGFAFGAGELLTLLSAFLFAIQIVATERALRQLHPTVLVAGQMLFAGLWGIVVFFLTGADLSGVATAGGAVSLLFLGVFSSFVCYLLQTVSQQYLSSVRAGILLAAESLFACLFSVLMGYDRLTLRMVAGGLILVAAGVLPPLLEECKRHHAASGQNAPAEK